ncbi:MAG: extracellular solute-binding protein, partial [Clostridia bacterium]|nr:extracellular solute-binding protein [Clostridia bacterium]
MKNFKSILCLILALVMVMALAACGEKQAEESKPQESKPAESKPVEGGEENDDPYAEAVTLKWVLSQPAGNQGQQDVEAALKKIVKEAINVDLECRWIDYNDYNTQMATIITAGDWDVATISGANFNANVARNAFLDLTPYLEAGALPTASAEIPADALQAGMYDGKVYAITPTKDIGSVYNNIINREMMEKIGIPIPEDRPTRRSLYGWMEEVNAKFREDPANADAHPLFSINTNMFNDYFYDSIISGNSTMGALVATNVA